MKHKYTVLFGAAFGIAMACIWCVVFSGILGSAGIGVGLALGAAFACCGCLIGHSIDRKNNDN